MSVNPSIRSRSSQTYCGAKQITGILAKRTVVVSRRASAASTRGAASAPAPASPIADSTRRLLSVMGIVNSFRPSCLQLALELVQKAPIGVFGDEFVGQRPDHARFVQPQRIIAKRVLGIVFPPLVVSHFLQGREGKVVAVGKPAIDDRSRGQLRIGHAEIGSLEKGPQYALVATGYRRT